jgi:hypothetical protein
LVRELRRGDVVLMVLLVRKKKGWNFGSTRIRMAAKSEIAGAAFWAVRSREEEEERIRNETRRCWWSMKLERRSGGVTLRYLVLSHPKNFSMMLCAKCEENMFKNLNDKEKGLFI